ncbi:MAG: hypothetical protein AAFW70_25785 [Cyanobacteria bacterium J06635_10]
MENRNLGFILKQDKTINPQVYPGRELNIKLEELRQISEGTLGKEVAQFYNDNGFESLKSGDWIQKTHNMEQVINGLSPSKNEQFILQAFTRSQVFRHSSAILVEWWFTNT